MSITEKNFGAYGAIGRDTEADIILRARSGAGAKEKPEVLGFL